MAENHEAVGVIVACYNSGALAGRPLIKLAGKSILQRCYEQAKEATCLKEVIIVTEDKRLHEHAGSFGSKSVLIEKNNELQANSLRLALSALTKLELKCHNVILIDDSQPFIHKSHIEQLLNSLITSDSSTQIATMGRIIENQQDLFNINKFKVVFDVNKFVLYFSRNVIPYVKTSENSEWLERHSFYMHIKNFAVRYDSLLRLGELTKSTLELAESFEPLRWLENGYRIKICITDRDSLSVSTAKELDAAEKIAEQTCFYDDE